MKLFIDFDNTIVESNKSIINILNKKYNLSKSEEDLKDYNFNTIYPISIEEKLDMFCSDDFFQGLVFKEGFIDFLDKYHDILEVTIVSKSRNEEQIVKKDNWIKQNIPYNVNFIGIIVDDLGKHTINMKDSIQIDDCTEALNTNAEIKILYKDFNDYPWQKDYQNKNILLTNTWNEISDIVEFYLQHNYKTLNDKIEGA